MLIMNNLRLSIASFRWRQNCVLFCLLTFLAGCGPSSKEICQENQAMVWDAAGSYYLEHSMKPDDLIDPQQLKDFYNPGAFPRCPLGTNDYAPFKLFDGPQCPHQGSGHGVVPMFEKIIKIKQNQDYQDKIEHKVISPSNSSPAPVSGGGR